VDLIYFDSTSVATDGHDYVTANQFHRQARCYNGQDQREQLCALFRIADDADPVLRRSPGSRQQMR